MPSIEIGKIPFNEAIEHFRGKLKIPTRHWDDLQGEANANAFTVAGATKADLLTDLYNAVNDAISNGSTITEFRKQFDQTVAKHGWTYKGKRGWRTRVIYDTNLRTSHAAGKWQQFQRVKSRRPFLQYFTVNDERVRPQHRRWHLIVLHIDDPWWSTHYPPNGWGCRCGARSLSLRQIRKEGLEISNQAPPLETTERINTATGEIYGDVPKGIDTGWNYNVGKAWLGPDIAFGEKIMSMPLPLRTAALNNAKDLAPHLEQTFGPWVNHLPTRKQPLGEIKTVGYLTPRVVGELARRGHVPTTAVITTTDNDIMHMIREAKNGKHLPVDMLESLPDLIHKPKAIYWDKQNPALLYVFEMPGNEESDKAVIRVNYKTRSIAGQTNGLRSGGLVTVNSLNDRAIFELLEGGI